MQSGIGGLMAPEALINDVPQVCHTMYEKVESPGKGLACDIVLL